MNIAFAGTPEFAAPALEALVRSSHRVVLVVTQPDRPAGRSGRPEPPPVKQVAQSHNLPVIQPEGINKREALARLRQAAPDVMVVVAYGGILARRTIDLPRLGTINIHASLLPKYRGASPIAHAILNGDTETGVTIQRVAPAVDTGAILSQRTLQIGPEEDAGQLSERLSALAAEMIVPVLDALEEGRAAETLQEESQATYAPKLAKSDGLIPWERDAEAVHNHIRAMTPWPGAFTFRHSAAGGKSQRVIILSSQVAESGMPCEGSSKPSQGSLSARQPCEGLNEPSQGGMLSQGRATPGAVMCAGGEVLVTCGSGFLRLLQVKPEGSRPMDATAWLCGRVVQHGDRFRGQP